MFTVPRCLHELRRISAALLAFSCVFLFGMRPGWAAEFAGGTLTVVRDADTADCPDEAALGLATLALGTPPATRSEGVDVRVVFQRDAFGYGALVTTTGAGGGVRELRKPGPSCAALAEAVSVVLAVFFDLVPLPEAAPTEAPAPAPPPAPPKVEVRPPPQPSRPVPPPAAPPRERGRELSFGASAAGGIAYGLLGPAPVGALSGAVRLGIGRWEVGAGALWAPNRTVSHLTGVVHVSVLAGRLGGCAWLFPSPSQPDVGLCAALLLGLVRGLGEGFDEPLPAANELWIAGEAGAASRWPLVSNLALRFGISAVIPSRTQRFTVIRGGTAFKSSPAAVLLELGPELRFW
jgi:hypothetical protein